MFARHNVVWISGGGWEELLSRADEQDRSTLLRWRDSDWPAIVRRRDEDAADEQVCIGIALPPDPVSGNKKRIGLRIAQTAVREVRAPLSIDEVIEAAPDRWRKGLESLNQAAQRLKLSIQVYGSLALQSLTRQSYVTAGSDIDVLFRPLSVAQLGTGAGLLTYYANMLPLDGEIIFPGEQAVAWQEWLQAVHASSNPRVLAKDEKAVALKTAASLLASFEEESRAGRG